MTGREYRKPISKHPPRYCDSSERRIMIAPFSRKITGKWDEEYVVARIIANMNIVGRWLSCIMPNLYFESGLRSGLMVTMSAPSQSIDPTMSFPGDVDILAIPYDENDLVLSETIADLYRFFGHEVKRFLNLNLVISYLPKKECSDDEFTNEVHRRIPA